MTERQPTYEYIKEKLSETKYKRFVLAVEGYEAEEVKKKLVNDGYKVKVMYYATIASLTITNFN